jgi:hypothetical protein
VRFAYSGLGWPESRPRHRGGPLGRDQLATVILRFHRGTKTLREKGQRRLPTSGVREPVAPTSTMNLENTSTQFPYRVLPISN